MASCTVRALPLLSYCMETELVAAFRCLQSGRNVGKVVVRVPSLRASPSKMCQGAQLLSGGTGSLGLLAARWLVQHGSGRLVLASRKVPCAPLVLGDLGAEVFVACADMGQHADVRRLIASMCCEPAQPLRG
eukprot:4824473-Pleurochrysis_carterae.AAC.1